MSESTYRSSEDEEPAREARVEALVPATRELLRQACDQGEAMAWERPRWVGRPGAWLLAAGVAAAGLLGPLAPSFGRIDAHPFFEPTSSFVRLLAGVSAVLLLSAFLLRSFALRAGDLRPGVYLFASSLVEIRDGWVRVWPVSSLSASSPSSDGVVVELSDERRVTLTARDNGLLAALRGAGDAGIVRRDRRDPLHLERGRSESWRRLPEPAPLPEIRDWVQSIAHFASLGTVLAVGLAVAATFGLGRWSDSLGIGRAVEQRDARALASYVQQKGLLAEQADDAWFDLIEQEPTARSLLAYLLTTAPRHRDEVNRRLFAQFPVEADSAVARHLLWQSVRGRWEEKRPSRVVLPAVTQEGEEHLFEGLRRHLGEMTPLLENYLRDGRREQPLRPQVEQRLFELRLVESRTAICPVPSRQGNSLYSDETPSAHHLGEDLLAAYIEQGGERAEEARAARWEQQLTQALTCHNLGDLEKTRSMISTPAQKAAFEAGWRTFFEALRGDTTLDSRTVSYGQLTLQESSLPAPLAEAFDALWVHLAAHPETQTRGPWSIRGRTRPAETAEDDNGWDGVLRMTRETREQLRTASTLPDFLGCLMPATFAEWETRRDGPHIALRLVEVTGATPREILEITLVLPGATPRTTRLSYIPSRDDVRDYRRRLWPCRRGTH